LAVWFGRWAERPHTDLIKLKQFQIIFQLKLGNFEEKKKFSCHFVFQNRVSEALLSPESDKSVESGLNQFSVNFSVRNFL